jgi:hypothetical protein
MEKMHGLDSFKIKGEKVSQLISCGYTLFLANTLLYAELAAGDLPIYSFCGTPWFQLLNTRPHSPPSVTSACDSLVEIFLQI